MKSAKKFTSSQHGDSNEQNGARLLPVTALLSERSLARDWLKPEEDRAWDYL
jgi:hypothetical protein